MILKIVNAYLLQKKIKFIKVLINYFMQSAKELVMSELPWNEFPAFYK